MYTLTTLETVPPFAVGYVRDLRVRWALEEAGQPYQVRAVSFDDAKLPAYRREQPFGQVPVLHDGDAVLFETGAILLHLADKHPALLQSTDRAQSTMWMFAALNSVEPYLANLAMFDLLSANEPWAAQQRPGLEQMALKRLGDLDAWLAGRDYLAGGFGVADIMMASVLRLMDSAKLVDRFPSLSAYKERCLSRPAFRKAHADQVSHFAAAKAA
jgi:glutathione S-transferase